MGLNFLGRKRKQLVDITVKNVSAVSKPANMRRFLVVKGAQDVEGGDALKDVVLDEDEIAKAIEKRVQARGSQFCVTSSDGSKTIACHATRAAAVRQLRAIEANKVKKGVFNDTMNARKRNVFKVLSEHFSSLMEAVDTIHFNPEKFSKPAEEIGKAVDEFVKSLQSAMPAVLKQMAKSVDGDAGTVEAVAKLRDELTTYLEGEDMSELTAQPTAEPTAQPSKTEPTKTEPTMKSADTKTEPKAEPTPSDDKLTEVLDIVKSLQTDNAALKERVEKAEERAEALEKQREDAEYQAIKDRYPGVAVSTDVIKAAKTSMTDEQFEQFEQTLRAASTQAATGALFKELGSSGPGIVSDGSATSEVFVKMQEVMSKGTDVDEDAAMNQVFAENPELYERYRQETTVGISNS